MFLDLDQFLDLGPPAEGEAPPMRMDCDAKGDALKMHDVRLGGDTDCMRQLDTGHR